MKNPILSICISTYNREKCLKSLLDSIIAQEGFSDEIEICIYNDPSTDNTQSMVESYQKRYVNVKYHRNVTRIGMVPSILNVAQMGSGEYAWLFSDDDIMDPTAIKIMLNTIKKEKPSLILNKFLGFKNEHKLKEYKSDTIGNIVTVSGIEKLFDYLSAVPYSIDGYMMHCSLFCFKRELFVHNLKTLLKEHGESYMNVLNKDFFGHIRIIYIPFGNTNKISVVEKDLVLLRSGNISWSFVFKTCTDYLHLAQDLHKKYKINRKTYRKMMILYYYSVFTYIVIVHLPKYMPKKLYDRLIALGKKIVKVVKIG